MPAHRPPEPLGRQGSDRLFSVLPLQDAGGLAYSILWQGASRVRQADVARTRGRHPGQGLPPAGTPGQGASGPPRGGGTALLDTGPFPCRPHPTPSRVTRRLRPRTTLDLAAPARCTDKETEAPCASPGRKGVGMGCVPEFPMPTAASLCVTSACGVVGTLGAHCPPKNLCSGLLQGPPVGALSSRLPPDPCGGREVQGQEAVLPAGLGGAPAGPTPDTSAPQAGTLRLRVMGNLNPGQSGSSGGPPSTLPVPTGH